MGDSTSGYPISEGSAGWFKGRLGELRSQIGEVRSLAQRAAGRAESAMLVASTDMHFGTTAERDERYGVPSTTAERVALANQNVSWFNTTKGYWEGYYATTGLAGLTAHGLVATVSSGWFPRAGTLLTATRVHVNGFQNIPTGGVLTSADMGNTFLVNVGGFTRTSTNDIILPIPGYYSVDGGVYYSGGGAMAYVQCLIYKSNGVGGWTTLLNSIIYGGPADMKATVSDRGILFDVGLTVTLNGLTAAAHNIYGDGLQRHTFLTVTYDGPPLVNG